MLLSAALGFWRGVVKEFFALLAWAQKHEGERMDAELAEKCPACEGWYPIVDDYLEITGELAEAFDALRLRCLAEPHDAAEHSVEAFGEILEPLWCSGGGCLKNGASVHH